MIDAQIIDIERLRSRLAADRSSFQDNFPFRHVVIDDFLSAEIAERLFASFPSLDAKELTLARTLEARSFEGNVKRFGPTFETVFAELGSPDFTSYVRELTGMDDLTIDPENVGGGLHQGARGSALHVHADHNTHPNDPSRYRRLNILIYMTKGWEAAWGGALELYDHDGKRKLDQIEPRFNRAVVMEVHDRAFHGYRALKTPDGVTRKLLAAYYYSDAPAPEQSVESHPTLLGRPEGENAASRALGRMRRWAFHKIKGGRGLTPTPKE